MKFPIILYEAKYKVILTEAQANNLLGGKVNFKELENNSMQLSIKKIKGVIDAWIDLELDLKEYSIFIVIKSSEMKSEKMWEKIHKIITNYAHVA